ncbi:MAG: hypothetical protein KGN77_05215 [Xanthomonadaceae bacterium]|nr:hypothetical protein [Xanthomonadaceae bacterium]
MPITASDLVFRRLQSDGGPITVFASLETTLPDGQVAHGSWRQTDVTITAAEQAVIDGITSRARQQIADQIQAAKDSAT